MTDYTRDTPAQGRTYCPGCEPDVDVRAEILDIRWCDSHPPQTRGEDDDRLPVGDYLMGSSEAGGADNRAWCAVLHRERRA